MSVLRERDVLPYEDNPGQTHWYGCWLSKGHHNCAVRRVLALEAKILHAYNVTVSKRLEVLEDGRKE